MPANLTGQTPAATYPQLLHVDGGLTDTLKTVVGGTGVQSALRVSTEAVGFGDLVVVDGTTLQHKDFDDGDGFLINRPTLEDATIGSLAVPLSVANGGTGGATQAAARTGLGLGSIATQSAASVSITGGTISGPSVRATSLGYTSGAYGEVTQVTNKATAVTINTSSGKITTNNASLNAGASVSFVVNNSLVSEADCVVVSQRSGGTLGAYEVEVDRVSAGQFTISLRNSTGGVLGEVLQLNFAVIKVTAA